ncbi:MAG: PEP-utilizing enzyme [Candidatus Paceibacterota bacterium]|jgi:phosphohistidine swiveling domain-containing protein
MKNVADFFFLERVPKGYPMDVLYINLGHTNIAKRPEFGLKTQGAMILVFSEGHYDIFLEKEKWFKAGQTVLDYVLENDDRFIAWERKTRRWLAYIAEVNNKFKKIDFGVFTDKELMQQLDWILEFEKTDGIENAEITSSNYGTNLIYQRFESTLKELGFAPHNIGQILLRSTRSFPLIEYEKEISRLAIWLINEKKNYVLDYEIADQEILNKIENILDEYDWLDASLASKPKSIQNVIDDINVLLQFKDKLSKVIAEREYDREDKRSEREKVLEAVLQRASSKQKRVIDFAIESSELGRILVDEIMKFIYYRRRIYAEIGKRIRLSEIETKYLLPEEIRSCLLHSTKPDIEIVRQRQEIFVCILENDQIDIYTGQQAKEWRDKLKEIVSNDVRPLKGEIAFSKGKIKGIAKIIRDVTDMDKIKNGDILVSSRTYPDLLPAMKKSSAIIAELGGLLSHAAIVSREFGIPCLVGVQNATSKIKDGDYLEIDTETGDIIII